MNKTKLITTLVSEFNSSSLWKNKRESSRPDSDMDKAFRYPAHLSAELIEMENFKMELLTWVDSENPYVILQLHGGGYVGAFKNQYRTMAGLYSEVSSGASVLSIDYRVAPADPFPAALEDALSAFDWLLANGYDEQHIILAGDSAGGGLGLALCHYLKDKDRPLPCGIIAMSPWADLACSGPSYTENAEIDPVFSAGDPLIFNSDYIGDDSPTNPYISPLYGDFAGFPPMLIQSGSNEMLLSDSTSVAEKAKLAGAKVRLSIYDGMFHVFQMCANHIPESRKAWVEVGHFIKEIAKG